MIATVSGKRSDPLEVTELNAVNDNGDVVSVLHEGRIGWWHRLTERFTVLGSLHRINHRASTRLMDLISKSEEVKVVILLLGGLIIPGALLLLSAAMLMLTTGLWWGVIGIIGSFIMALFVINAMMDFDLNHDELTPSLAIPRGLMMSIMMDDQPFIIAVGASLDDARMICEDDRDSLKAMYERHSRIIQSGDLSGAVVYSPGKISDESMIQLIPRMEQAIRRYTANQCAADRDGEKLEASLAPSETLDGFNESISATDEKRVASMDTALSTRLWSMRNSVLDARRIGDALKLEPIYETCDNMSKLIDDVAEHWQDWKQHHGEEHDGVSDDDYYAYYDSIDATMQQLETRISGLVKMLSALAADQVRAEELTENLDSLSDSITEIYRAPVTISAL